MSTIIQRDPELAPEIEAGVLAAFAIHEGKGIEALMLILRDLVNNTWDMDAEYWSHKVADYIQDKTGAIWVEKEYDVDIETGDWGLPVVVGAGGSPEACTIRDPEYLAGLLRALEDTHGSLANAISKFLAKPNNPKWVCKNTDCKRFLGKELATDSEILQLLRRFRTDNFWRCRSCKIQNSFMITESGDIIFM